MFLNILLLSIWKKFKIYFSYRFFVVLNIITGILQVIWLYYLSRFVHVNFGGYSDYFSYAFIGILSDVVIQNSIYGFRNVLRQEQVEGTLEMVMASPTPIEIFALGSAFSEIVKGLLIVFIMFLTGLFMGANIVLNLQTIISLLIFLPFMITAFLGFGFAASGVIMVTKKGDPVLFTYSWLNRLLGNMYFPARILPPFVNFLRYILPLSFALNGIRAILLKGHFILEKDVAINLAILIIFTAVTLPAGLLLFKKGVKRAKKEGTLHLF